MIARGTGVTSGLARGRGNGKRGLSLNLTSMIDVVFLLVVFFMLAAHLSRDRMLPLNLPHLGRANTPSEQEDNRAVLNVVPTDRIAKEGGAYRMGQLTFADGADGVRALSEALADLRERDPKASVLVRAERTERYDRVLPALEAVSGAGINRVDLALVPISGGGTQP